MKIVGRANTENGQMSEDNIERFLNVRLIEAAVDNMADFNMWVERLLYEIEDQNPMHKNKQYELFKEAKRQDLQQGIAWKPQLISVSQELDKTDEYKQVAETLKTQILETTDKMKEVKKNLEDTKKYKMSAEKKIRELQNRANKLPTLELEIKNLKEKLLRAEKSREMIAGKLKEKQNNELRERNTTENSIMRGTNESFNTLNLRDPSASIDHKQKNASNFKNLNEKNINIEYNFKTKTEMKSLKGLVKYLNKQLISQKSKNMNYRLFNFKQRSKNFEKLTKMYNSGVKLTKTPVDLLQDSNFDSPDQKKNKLLTDLLESNVNSESQQPNLEVLVEKSEDFSDAESNPYIWNTIQ